MTVLVFVAGAFGLLAYKVDYSTTTFFKKSVESVEGFELLEEAFPAGMLPRPRCWSRARTGR